jgi:phosphohistidine phosphatase
MKTLIVLRHAKSSWKDNNLADYERPLNKRGKYDAPRMGALLVRQDLVPNLIISSSAKRAATTAKAVAENCGYEDEIQYSRHLYAAWPEAYIEALNDLMSDYPRVMVVGHNPGIEDLVEELTGEWVRMPTAALAQIDLAIGRWSDLALEASGKLVNVWWPKELD